mgnify:CR=1 FL=1
MRPDPRRDSDPGRHPVVVPPEDVAARGRLQPGKMFVASLEEGRIIPDEEIKARIAAQQTGEGLMLVSRGEGARTVKIFSPDSAT